MIIKNCQILSVNEKNQLDLFYGDILIKYGKIEKIGKINRISRPVIDAKNKLVLPGFINTHFHLGETLYEKLIHPKSTEEYISITENIWRRVKNKKFVRKTTVNYSLVQLIKSGITCFVSARSWSETRKSGLRAFLGYPLMLSRKLRKYSYLFSRNFEKIRKKFKENNKIKVGFWLHSLNFVNRRILEEAAELFEKFGDSFLTIHINESSIERESIVKMYGEEPIKVLDSFGLLNERTLLVHCNYLSKNEIKLIKKRKSKVSLSPVSAYFLCNKLPDLSLFLKEKIPISLSSDNLVVSRTFNILKMCNFVLSIYENEISCEKLFNLITKDAAECINSQMKIGSVEEGKYAELIFFENKNKLFEKNEIIEWLITKFPTPSDVFVGGRFLMKNKKVLPFNEDEVRRNYERVRSHVKELVQKNIN